MIHYVYNKKDKSFGKTFKQYTLKIMNKQKYNQTIHHMVLK